MYEKVNPMHPDKICDRIAGALVDYAYTQSDSPKIAVEGLIGHGECNIIAETSVHIPTDFVEKTVERISGEKITVRYKEVPQDVHLAENQENGIRCGDNGIFKGVPVTKEQIRLSNIARAIYANFPYDGKYVITNGKLIICQSHAETEYLKKLFPKAVVNPLGDWTGGTSVDVGAVNRKLGSDMGDSVTGGGLWGKDYSKADLSVNIYAWLKAQERHKTVRMSCAIGDTELYDGERFVPYSEIVEVAKNYISSAGGFEKFAEWGLF